MIFLKRFARLVLYNISTAFSFMFFALSSLLRDCLYYLREPGAFAEMCLLPLVSRFKVLMARNPL